IYGKRNLKEIIKYAIEKKKDKVNRKSLRDILKWYTKKKRPGALPKLQAGPGAHDDYTIAMALAHKHINLAPNREPRRNLGQRARGWVGF
ncbi:hypothetical protein LCGC14_2670280, partial [marine sediment metagenome]